MTALAVVVGMAILVWAVVSRPVTASVSGGVVLLVQPDPTGPIVVSSLAPGGVLAIASNGCITVGGAFLVAPHGSTLLDRELRISDVGDYRVGDVLPETRGIVAVINPSELPARFVRCGPGTYVFPVSNH